MKNDPTFDSRWHDDARPHNFTLFEGVTMAVMVVVAMGLIYLGAAGQLPSSLAGIHDTFGGKVLPL